MGEEAECHGLSWGAPALGVIAGEAAEDHVVVVGVFPGAAEGARNDVVERELVGLVVVTEHEKAVAVVAAVAREGRGAQRLAACAATAGLV